MGVQMMSLFQYFRLPSPTDKVIISLADAELSSMVQVLFNKVIATTSLFTLNSFSKQLASWNVLEICEMCELSTDSQMY